MSATNNLSCIILTVSTFICLFVYFCSLDEFKRVYSNEDIKTKAIPYFWENFDKENFSIWMCEYQYPEVRFLILSIGNETIKH